MAPRSTRRPRARRPRRPGPPHVHATPGRADGRRAGAEGRASRPRHRGARRPRRPVGAGRPRRHRRLVRFESLRERARGLPPCSASGGAPRAGAARSPTKRRSRRSRPRRRAADELDDVEAEASAPAPSDERCCDRDGRVRPRGATSRLRSAEGVTPPSGARRRPAVAARGTASRREASAPATSAELDRGAQRSSGPARGPRSARARRLLGELRTTRKQPRPAAERSAPTRPRPTPTPSRAARQRRRGGRGRAGAPRTPSATRGPAAPTRLAQALDEARARPAVAWPTSTACSARCSTSSRSTRARSGAFEAAAGEALAAVVVDDDDAARRALERARTRATPSGAVVPPVPGPRRLRSRRRRASRGAHVARCVAQPRSRCRRVARRALRRGSCVDGDWKAAVDLVLAEPDAVIVTRDGDRSAPRRGASAARAGRRCGSPRPRRAEAPRAAAASRPPSAHAARRPRRGGTDELDARRADSAAAEADRGAGRGRGVERARAERTRDARRESSSLRLALGDLELAARRRREARIAELEVALPELEAEEAGRSSGPRAARSAQPLEERAAAVGALRTDIEVRAAARSTSGAGSCAAGSRRSRSGSPATRRARAAEERRRELERTQRASTASAALRGRRLDDASRPSSPSLHEQRRRQSEDAPRGGGAARRLRTQRAADERPLEELRERAAGPSSRRPSSDCGSRPPSRRCAAISTASPTRRWPPMSRLPEGTPRPAACASSNASCG